MTGSASPRQPRAGLWIRFLLGTLGLGATAAVPGPVPGLAVRWETPAAAPAAAVVVVEGLPPAQLRALEGAGWTEARWQRLLAVHAEPGDPLADLGLPPMAGRHTVVSNVVRFDPAFPLRSGLRYRAVFRPAELPDTAPPAPDARPKSAVHRVPERARSGGTEVVRIHPSAAVLPENLLKFYVHFSAPMSRGHIYDHIELREASTRRPVELPFLEIDEELWDPTMRRLTLLLDPGRIKRGVKPLEDIGPALEVGKRYELTLRRTWQDAEGSPLKDDYARTFEVGPPDREPPDPASWIVAAPAAGGSDALRVSFPEPLDHAIVLRVFRVRGPDGAEVTGTPELADEERRWSFVPTRPWRSGDHRLLVPTSIEDLAGNNIGKPFDVDLFERVERRLTNTLVTVPFVVR